jgi:hypothetical protein
MTQTKEQLFSSDHGYYNLCVEQWPCGSIQVDIGDKGWFIEGLDLKAIKDIDKMVLAAYKLGIKEAKAQLRYGISEAFKEVDGRV